MWQNRELSFYGATGSLSEAKVTFSVRQDRMNAGKLRRVPTDSTSMLCHLPSSGSEADIMASGAMLSQS